MKPGKKIQHPTVEFFVNPPEGADHSLKQVNRINFDLKIFLTQHQSCLFLKLFKVNVVSNF